MTISAAGLVPEWTVGDRLRKAREVTGLDIGEFADSIGLSRNSVSKYEKSDKAPRPIVLRAWALCCGVSTEWLELGIPPGTPPGRGIDVNFGWSKHQLSGLPEKVIGKPRRLAA